jgi:catechol 2,3-dioxygenase-like lactoylglutathione lyase family enzyme
MAAPTLRIARPSDDLDALLRFYRDGLGLNVLYHFEDHDGFDGLMLGLEGAPYHFEFTKKRGHLAGRAPTNDNLVVFYYPDAAEWHAAAQRMRNAGFVSMPSFNPYWDRNGLTFEDADGYRVVLQNEFWNL